MSDETINISDIIVEDRARQDLGPSKGPGSIDELAASIKEFRLIQPLVLVRQEVTAPDDGGSSVGTYQPKLVAGGRRLAALKRLGVHTLNHGRDFIWRDEILSGDLSIQHKMKAIELEENVKRKEMSWLEQVRCKKQLLDLMQQIHGVSAAGGRTREELRTGATSGFSIKKLSSMLGEAFETTRRDIEIANIVSAIPALAKATSKEQVLAKVGTAILTLKHQAAAPVVPSLSYRILVFCDSEEHQARLLAWLEDEGLKCQPLIV
jgi:hypothetical protein